MRNLLFLFVCVTPLALFAQMNQTDSSGLRQGRWQKTDPGGQLIYEGEFNNGQPSGHWTRYYKGGQVKAKIRYSENSDSAFTQLFDRRGKKVAEGVHVNEKKEGKWIYYFNNVIIWTAEYKDDLKHGISRKFYPSGEVLEEAGWEKGKQDGKLRVFFKNGNPYLKCGFSNGKRNGLCLTYFQNGRLEMEAHYKNNLRNDEWKFYNAEGDYLYSLNYNEGILLNPEVRDSIDNLEIQNMEKGKEGIPDPEKFLEDPSGFMMQMQKPR